MLTKLLKYIFPVVVLLLATTSIFADEKEPVLEKKIQDVKKEVLDLNKELFILQEDLLFPANTQFSVFLSMDVGNLFDLDSVEVNIDGKNISNHLYTLREIDALKRGGVQRVYLGNIASGKHELVAFFIGKGPNKRAYKRGTTLNIEKTSSPLFVELKIIDNLSSQQPDFKTKVWE